jgi:hypothetical protein
MQCLIGAYHKLLSAFHARALRVLSPRHAAVVVSKRHYRSRRTFIVFEDANERSYLRIVFPYARSSSRVEHGLQQIINVCSLLR